MNPEKVFKNNKKCFKAPNQHIRMISEASCDTEEMTAENSALHHGNKLHFKIYCNRKQPF